MAIVRRTPKCHHPSAPAPACSLTLPLAVDSSGPGMIYQALKRQTKAPWHVCRARDGLIDKHFGSRTEHKERVNFITACDTRKDTQGGVLRGLARTPLLAFREDGEQNVVVRRHVEGACQDGPGFGQVGRLQQSVLHVAADAADRHLHVGVEGGVGLTKADYLGGVDLLPTGRGGSRGRPTPHFRLQSQEVDKVPAGETVDVVDVKVRDDGEGV
ncbi:hypothetical protein EYF80_039397 [Liparis tanakae]|uniref:Uncharacterized protein n=1 Tax=Liparis tanakae TaxID=230148 RepID=A0A4Z2GB17_9TELE|nr:hypothetical protein EYF80_039397 [Liparis tanakae]